MRSMLALILLAIATTALSKDDDPFDITLYGSFLHTAQIPDTLFFSMTSRKTIALNCVELCEITK